MTQPYRPDATAGRSAEPRYWAFISYSNQDREVAEWLHRSIETYRIPRRFVGRDQGGAAIPRRLYPIFRDRDELPTSSDLGEGLRTALRRSRNLLVLCSPNAAASRWVDQEVREFKALGREDRIFCVMVDNVADSTHRPPTDAVEYFPPALRHHDHGVASDDPDKLPLAADLRQGGDSRRVVLLKVIAGFLGLMFDELWQRDRLRSRARALQLAAAVIMTILLLGWSGWQWRSASDADARIEPFKDEPVVVFLEEKYSALFDGPSTFTSSEVAELETRHAELSQRANERNRSLELLDPGEHPDLYPRLTNLIERISRLDSARARAGRVKTTLVMLEDAAWKPWEDTETLEGLEKRYAEMFELPALVTIADFEAVEQERKLLLDRGRGYETLVTEDCGDNPACEEIVHLRSRIVEVLESQDFSERVDLLDLVLHEHWDWRSRRPDALEYTQAWEQAVEDVGENASYTGLELLPQEDLVPLGADPSSGLLEFAHLLSGEPPRRNQDGRLELTPYTGIVFVLIPGGHFTMGAFTTFTTGDSAWTIDSMPQHPVTVPSFFLSKYELTLGQWIMLARARPGKIQRPLRPAHSISWHQSSRVLEAVGLRLPSEAEWEYSARAGGSGAPFSDLGWYASYKVNSTETRRVGSYRPNDFGLYDMHGNVWEWCQDPRHDDYDGHPGDGSAWEEGDSPERSIRGGSFTSDAHQAMAAARAFFTSTSVKEDVGLRPARSIEP